MEDVAGCTPRRLVVPPLHNPREVLANLRDGGWSRVLYSEIQDVVRYVDGFGLAHLTSDPEMHRIFEFLRTDSWARIAREDIQLFAMTILDETEV